jgi:hypothetical protein
MKLLSKLHIILFIFTSTLTSAEVVVRKLDTNKKIATILILKSIEYKEEIELEEALDKLTEEGYTLKMNAVQINSVGGFGNASMAMGRLIRSRNLNTYLGPNSQCHSACIDVVVGGVERMVYGTLTIHRNTYKDKLDPNDLPKVIERDNEKMSTYYKEMGMSFLLIDKVLMTPHWTSHVVSMNERQQLGILGTERIYEERYIRQIAQENNLLVDDVEWVINKNYVGCNQTAMKFKMTFLECIKSKLQTNKK